METGNRRNKETEGRGISKRKAEQKKGLKTEGDVEEEEQDGKFLEEKD